MKTLSLLAVCACAVFVSCNSSGPTDPIDDDTGTPTAIGTPIGSPTTLTIDASGGSVLSPDGRLEIIIPADALSTATEISIQPVVNETPAGSGVGFSMAIRMTGYSTSSLVLQSQRTQRQFLSRT